MLPGLFVLLLASVLHAQAPAPVGGGSEALADRIKKEGLDNSQVMQWQDYLCNHIGQRLTGSFNYDRAVTWTKQQFEKMGLAVTLEEWGEWRVRWDRGQWTGRMVKPQQVEFQVATPAWTAPTKGEVRGRIVAMPADAKSAKKLVKILKKEPVYLFEDRPRARQGRAQEVQGWIEQGRILGIVQTATSTGLTDKRFKNQIRVFGDSRRAPKRDYALRPKTPQIVVRDDHGALLTKRLKSRRPVIVEFDIRNRFTPGPVVLNNVVARLEGSARPKEAVIVSAHLDSWHQATGATDNGTGVCTTLEAARILTTLGVKPKRTILFILFGGEEQGLLGSGGYVKRHRADMNLVSAVFNHDNGTNWAHSLTITDAMLPQLKGVFAPILELKSPDKKHRGATFELITKPTMKPGGGSDHVSFQVTGVPAWQWGLKGPRPYGYGWHSQWDTYSIVVPEYQRHNATVIALAAFGVANLDKMLTREGVLRRGQK
ncbi:MAG: hypothetical protein CMJ85_02745 [Planctomycetes bacterium]|jgi:hypothetical protein|nr:hypothetical protein [Planctomycetota bacterium]MDP6423845.1 M20/M25/M40 family metallo-hydrolase [Planctomycetota bacterium]